MKIKNNWNHQPDGISTYIKFNWVFHYKPSILGYPYFGNPLFDLFSTSTQWRRQRWKASSISSKVALPLLSASWRLWGWRSGAGTPGKWRNFLPEVRDQMKGNVDLSENRGTPKSSILKGFSIINHPFWGTPIFGNTHIIFQASSFRCELFMFMVGKS